MSVGEIVQLLGEYVCLGRGEWSVHYLQTDKLNKSKIKVNLKLHERVNKGRMVKIREKVKLRKRQNLFDDTISGTD